MEVAEEVSDNVVSLSQYRQKKDEKQVVSQPKKTNVSNKSLDELNYVRELTHLILTNMLELLEKEGYDITQDDVLDYAIGAANMIQAGLVSVHDYEHPLENIYTLAMEDTAKELIWAYGKDYKKPTTRESAVIDLTRMNLKKGK